MSVYDDDKREPKALIGAVSIPLVDFTAPLGELQDVSLTAPHGQHSALGAASLSITWSIHVQGQNYAPATHSGSAQPEFEGVRNTSYSHAVDGAKESIERSRGQYCSPSPSTKKKSKKNKNKVSAMLCMIQNGVILVRSFGMELQWDTLVNEPSE